MRTYGRGNTSESLVRVRPSVQALGTMLVLLLGPTAAWATRAPCFEPYADYNLADSEPRTVVVADFNLDGHLDLAVSTSTDGEVGVLLGDGAGHFVDEPFETGISGWGLATADFNHDNVPDLALSNGGHAHTSVHVYLGAGDGTFVLQSTASAGQFPLAIVAARFDGDAHVDLAVANNVTQGLSLLVGDGLGNFSGPTQVPAAASLLATDMVGADVNHDTHMDLILSHYYGVQVLLGSGGGSFASGANVGLGELNEAVAAGDLDNNGDVDVASLALYSGTLVINYGLGDGTFSAGQTYAAGYAVRDLEIADVNLDGWADVVVPRDADNRVLVFRNDGTGALLPPRLLTAGLQPVAVAVGDWNEDGLPDLAAPCRNLGDAAYTSVLLQRPLGDLTCDGVIDATDFLAFEACVAGPDASVAADCDVADLDSDGDVDLLDTLLLQAAP